MGLRLLVLVLAAGCGPAGAVQGCGACAGEDRAPLQLASSRDYGAGRVREVRRPARERAAAPRSRAPDRERRPAWDRPERGGGWSEPGGRRRTRERLPDGW